MPISSPLLSSPLFSGSLSRNLFHQNTSIDSSTSLFSLLSSLCLKENTHTSLLMAVEAHHLNLLPSQLLRNREFISNEENQASLYNMQMGLITPETVTAVDSGCSFLPMYASFGPDLGTAVSDSGLTFDNAASLAASMRKRPLMQFLGVDDVPYHLPPQMLDVDRLVLQHAERVQEELAERRQRFTRQVLAAVEGGVSKRLRAREEEIARIGRMNWALEERIKRLCVENQLWREAAQSNEAAANALRANLEQVVATAQVRLKEEEETASSAAAAESCCVADNGREEDEEEGGASRRDRRKGVCRSCGEREPSLVLLPCRHLCLCAACGPSAAACPICDRSRSGSLTVNLF